MRSLGRFKRKENGRKTCVVCRVVSCVRYFASVRRDLVVFAVVGSLLWAGAGLSVLAVALHEHSHHPHEHDHSMAVAAALHGHAHKSAPDHDHEFAAPLTASRISIAFYTPELSVETAVAVDDQPDISNSLAAQAARCLQYGAPPYLMNCVLLT